MTPRDNSPADLDLEAIEARCKAAYPGPWLQKFSFAVEAEDGRGVCSTGGYTDSRNSERVHADNVALAAFIAHARQDIPALLAEIRRIQSAPRTGEAPEPEQSPSPAPRAEVDMTIVPCPLCDAEEPGVPKCNADAYLAWEAQPPPGAKEGPKPAEGVDPEQFPFSPDWEKSALAWMRHQGKALGVPDWDTCGPLYLSRAIAAALAAPSQPQHQEAAESLLHDMAAYKTDLEARIAHALEVAQQWEDDIKEGEGIDLGIASRIREILTEGPTDPVQGAGT
jgi:hypothetical protein